MKYLMLAGLAVLSLSFFSNNAGLNLGDPMPLSDKKMKEVSGTYLSLNDVKGKKGTLVVFSCNTCPFVLATQKRYQEVAKSCKALGIGLLVVNSNEAQRFGVDSYEAMQDYAKDQGYEAHGIPYVLDENHALADAFGATRTPDVFLFDGMGKLVYKGAIDDSHRDPEQVKEHYLSQALTHLVEGKPIDPAETKAVGCTIKRTKE